MLSMGFIKHIVITFAMLTLFYDLSSQSEHSILLHIKKVEKMSGNIMIALYNTSESFLGNNVFKHVIIPVENIGLNAVKIENIPFGTYAISLYQDLNNNGVLDANLFKLPKEPYGFSNNAKNNFGPPSFDKAKLEFKEPFQLVEIELK